MSQLPHFFSQVGPRAIILTNYRLQLRSLKWLIVESSLSDNLQSGRKLQIVNPNPSSSLISALEGFSGTPGVGLSSRPKVRSASPPIGKRVRFSDPADVSLDTGDTEDEIDTSVQEISQEVELCGLLSTEAFNPTGRAGKSRKKAIARLNGEQAFLHLLYPSTGPLSSLKAIHHTPESDGSSIHDLLLRTAGDVATKLSAGAKLNLALRLVLAVLQYSPTPWLGPDWGLKDIFFLGSHMSGELDILDTLHVRAMIQDAVTPPNTTCSTLGAPTCTPRGIEEAGLLTPSKSSRWDEEKLIYGVDEVALFNLGIALLEIGHWQPLESMRRPEDINNVVAARRIAKYGQYALTRGYMEIIKKCLRCDFGAGTELSSNRLVAAIHQQVVCPLRKLIDYCEAETLETF